MHRARRRDRKRTKIGRAVLWTGIGAGVLLMSAGLWLGIRGGLAYGHLEEARPLVADVAASLKAGDAPAAPIAALQNSAGAARELTSDLIWRSVAWVPWLGEQTSAVSVLAEALDVISQDALPEVVTAAEAVDLDALLPGDGSVDVSTLSDAGPGLKSAAAAFARASELVAAVDVRKLAAPLAGAFDEIRAPLNQAGSAADAAARASALLPSMLGDEDREYLLLFQNNAELRSSGGIVGAMMQVSWTAGRLTITRQSSSADFDEYTQPAPLPADATRLFGDSPARYVQNVTQVPEFATAGALAQTMWRDRWGVEVDGVLAVDPAVLARILDATGSVKTEDGQTIAGANAVQTLLNTTYLTTERAWEQDRLFADVAEKVFTRLFATPSDGPAVLAALADAAEQRRVLAWSAHPAEQALLEPTSLAGLVSPTSPADEVVVLLNDATGGKMDFYLSVDTDLEWTGCERGAESAARLRLRLSSAAPADAAQLPWLLTGGGNYGVPAGTIRTVVHVILPPGFDVDDAELPDAASLTPSRYAGRITLTFQADLGPGATADAAISFRSDAAPSELRVITTPTTASPDPTEATCR